MTPYSPVGPYRHFQRTSDQAIIGLLFLFRNVGELPEQCIWQMMCVPLSSVAGAAYIHRLQFAAGGRRLSRACVHS
jgi:hypothetical protein